MQLGSGKKLVVETDHWSSLPRDILGLISDNIDLIEDYVGFSAACRSWHVHAADLYPLMRYKLSFRPYYMLGTNLHSNRGTIRNPKSDATLTVDLPESHRCWGTPSGWLITFDPENRLFTLLNPLTGATIPIPPLPVSESEQLTPGSKAFLTANPDSDPDDLGIIVSGFSKSSLVSPARRRKNWSCVSTDFSNVACSQDKLYGIQSFDTDKARIQVVLIELNHRTPHRLVPVMSLDMIPLLSLSVDMTPRGCHIQLADVMGQLCLCVRCCWADVKVFKIDLSLGTLTHLWSLGGHCLFMSEDCTFSCKTSYRYNFFHPFEFVSNDLSHYRCYDSSGFNVSVWDMLCSDSFDLTTYDFNPNESFGTSFGGSFNDDTRSYSDRVYRRTCHYVPVGPFRPSLHRPPSCWILPHVK